ncbi:hypothetical protein Leryth_016322 [Lithospermum erythrorhizon]|nr:hypothetical protein Leryth_016322 [Lithospermum erythrorhizon]
MPGGYPLPVITMELMHFYRIPSILGFTQDESDVVENDGTHIEDEQEDVKKNDRGRIRIKSKICKVVAMVAQAK